MLWEDYLMSLNLGWSVGTCEQFPVSPVSLTAPTRDFQSQFKRQILVANWKKIPRQFH